MTLEARAARRRQRGGVTVGSGVRNVAARGPSQEGENVGRAAGGGWAPRRTWSLAHASMTAMSLTHEVGGHLRAAGAPAVQVWPSGKGRRDVAGPHQPPPRRMPVRPAHLHVGSDGREGARQAHNDGLLAGTRGVGGHVDRLVAPGLQQGDRRHLVSRLGRQAACERPSGSENSRGPHDVGEPWGVYFRKKEEPPSPGNHDSHPETMTA
eukprot:scaffold14379_cov121-Isochrysis_galbana.AAC.4